MMERFVRQASASETFDRWAHLTAVIDKAIAAFNAWAHSRASIFSRDDERVIGQGIIAKCQLEGLNPVSETDRKTAASSIAEVDQLGRYQEEGLGLVDFLSLYIRGGVGYGSFSTSFSVFDFV